MTRIVHFTKRFSGIFSRSAKNDRGRPQIGRPQRLSPISQESVIRSPSLDPNDLESELAELTYPAPLASSADAPGSSDRAKEPEIKFLCTVTRDGWTPLGERPVVVKQEREEEERVPEEVPLVWLLPSLSQDRQGEVGET